MDIFQRRAMRRRYMRAWLALERRASQAPANSDDDRRIERLREEQKLTLVKLAGALAHYLSLF